MGLFDFIGDLLGFDDPADVAKENAKSSISQSQQFYDKFLAQFLEPAKAEGDMLWDVALGFAEDQPGIISKGYDRAMLGVERFGQQGRADILDLDANNRAGVGQSFASTGLFGSSAHAGGLDMVTSSTARALGSLNAALAGQSAALQTGKAHALSGAYQGIGSAYAGKAGFGQQFLGQQLGAAMGAPVFANPGGVPPAASFLSGLFQTAAGTGGLF